MTSESFNEMWNASLALTFDRVRERIADGTDETLSFDTDNVRPIDEIDLAFTEYAASRWDD